MTTIETPPRALRQPPVEIAHDTYVIQATQGEGVAPVAVHLNSMVIRGRNPVVVDTGAPVHRQQHLDDLFSLVEPEDVRWVFVSHDDVDHYGNLEAVMAACPNATLVASWFLCERLMCEGLTISPRRWRWLDDGDILDTGDRRLALIRPPLYDSPTTRGLYDPTTGVYWASDCYATPVPASTAFVDDLDPEFWADGFTNFQAWNSPWVRQLDRDAFVDACSRIERLDVSTIATAHGPTIPASHLGEAFRLLRGVPDADIRPQPGQPLLDDIVAGLAT